MQEAGQPAMRRTGQYMQTVLVIEDDPIMAAGAPRARDEFSADRNRGLSTSSEAYGSIISPSGEALPLSENEVVESAVSSFDLSAGTLLAGVSVTMPSGCRFGCDPY